MLEYIVEYEREHRAEVAEGLNKIENTSSYFCKYISYAIVKSDRDISKALDRLPYCKYRIAKEITRQESLS